MKSFWKFLRGARGDASRGAEPAAAAESVSAAPLPASPEPPLPALPEATVSATAPTASPRPLSETGLSALFTDALRRALHGGARLLLADPEEFDCTLSLLVDGGLETIAECTLDAYAEAQPLLEALDHEIIEDGDTTRQVSIYTAVTDLGRRVVVQLFEPTCDAEVASDIRKANARAINRLRPGTSLTRHNRTRLRAALARAGVREGPSFLQRLHEEGVDTEGTSLSLEDFIGCAVLPRKAVARAMAAWLGLPFVDVEETLPRDHAHLFGRARILEWEAIPCGECGDGVEVAMADPTDEDVLAAMKALLGRAVLPRVAAATDIRVAADKLFKPDEP